jgi:hypothetical protein
MKIDIHRLGANGAELAFAPHGRGRGERLLRIYGQLGALTGGITLYGAGAPADAWLYVTERATVAGVGDRSVRVRAEEEGEQP